MTHPREPKRKFSPGARIGLAIVAALCLWGLAQGILFVRNWLAHHENHTISLGQVELWPPPPAYLRGGRAILLANLEKSSGMKEPIPLLDQDLGEIADLFRVHCPWVEKVTRLERKPGKRLVVSLNYREPKAKLVLLNADAYALDGETHVLPIEDLTPEFVAQLVPIRNLAATGARPGLRLETAKAAKRPDRTDPDAIAALRMAEFLAQANRNPTLPGLSIAMHEGARNIFLRVESAKVLWIYWGEPPGEETPGLLGAPEKFAKLRDWCAKLSTVKLAPAEYYDLNDAEPIPRKRRKP